MPRQEHHYITLNKDRKEVNMKKSIIYFLLLILIVSIYGCGDSIYGNVDNNGSQASKQDQLDFDFISIIISFVQLAPG